MPRDQTQTNNHALDHHAGNHRRRDQLHLHWCNARRVIWKKLEYGSTHWPWKVVLGPLRFLLMLGFAPIFALLYSHAHGGTNILSWRKSRRAIWSWLESASFRWPWKIVLAPFRYLFFVGVALMCIFVWMPNEQGGWVKMFKKWREDKQRKARLKTWRPAPLVNGSWKGDTRRGLGKLTPNWKRKAKPMLPQAQSPLFSKLPLEVREQVFASVIEAIGPRLHVHVSYGRFGFAPCSQRSANTFPHDPMICLWNQLDQTTEEPTKNDWSRLVLWNDSKIKFKPEASADRDCARRCDELLGLALTCKRGAQEYLPLLYRTPTLAFTSLSQFGMFARTIPATSLQMIRHLEFHVEYEWYITRDDRNDVASYDDVNRYRRSLNPWRAGWKAIASAEGLRTLKVTTLCKWNDDRFNSQYGEPGVNSSWIEEGIFKPMREVTRVRDEFLVLVNWPVSQGFDLGDVPFQLRRNTERRHRGRNWIPPRVVNLEEDESWFDDSETVPGLSGAGGPSNSATTAPWTPMTRPYVSPWVSGLASTNTVGHDSFNVSSTRPANGSPWVSGFATRNAAGYNYTYGSNVGSANSTMHGPPYANVPYFTMGGPPPSTRYFPHTSGLTSNTPPSFAPQAPSTQLNFGMHGRGQAGSSTSMQSALPVSMPTPVLDDSAVGKDHDL